MKILVACEESQRVCMAFRAKGHESYSCDIIMCSGASPNGIYGLTYCHCSTVIVRLERATDKFIV